VYANTTTDWITAIGSSFAAVGTVGAVIVALWQARAQERYGLQVSTRSLASIDLKGGGDHQVLIELIGVNHGRRPITINDAELGFDVGPVRFSVGRADDNEFPITLRPGDRAVASWDKEKAERLRAEQGGEPFTHATFVDSFGNDYSAPVPGVTVSRRNWRLQRRYVARET
jgi:hypothetical protein